MPGHRPTIADLRELRRRHDVCKCRSCAKPDAHCAECAQPYPCDTRQYLNEILGVEG